MLLASLQSLLSVLTTVGIWDMGYGVIRYLIDRFESRERKGIVLVAHMRFNNVVDAYDGTEVQKVDAAKLLLPDYDGVPISNLLSVVMRGGGAQGVLGTMLSYV